MADDAAAERDGAQPRRERYSEFKLYGFWRSSCTWRVRIALNAKGIPYETISVNLFEKDQAREGHASRNPMRQVPVLEFVDGDGDNVVVRLTQSLAIVEFLETAFADRGGGLLPVDPVARARAKEAAEIVNSGIQPLQNMSVVERVEGIGWDGGKGSGMRFAQRNIENGLSALEALLAPHYDEGGAMAAGPYALGTHGPNLADACLIPQLYNARRFGVDCAPYRTLLMIERACEDHPWFRDAVPELQPDYKVYHNHMM